MQNDEQTFLQFKWCIPILIHHSYILCAGMYIICSTGNKKSWCQECNIFNEIGKSLYWPVMSHNNSNLYQWTNIILLDHTMCMCIKNSRKICMYHADMKSPKNTWLIKWGKKLMRSQDIPKLAIFPANRPLNLTKKHAFITK